MSEEQGLTVKKSDNFSEWYTQVISKAELADMRYNVKGFLVHRPWSVKIMKNMYSLLEKELEAKGHEPVWFPSVIPESFFEKESEHAKGFKAEVFWITEGGSDGKRFEERLALRPTSETAMYTMFALWIQGWKDLPLKMYQSCQVWRYEGKATRPFIRGREFFWIEAHDVFASEREALAQVKEDMETTENIVHKMFGLPFLFLIRPKHDTFAGAVNTFAADSVMPDGKIIQLPSTHMLGQNFSKAFDIKFLDENEKKTHAWQTCYGPAVWRIFGALVAMHGDDKGLVIPPAISPIDAAIVPILFEKDKKEVLQKCETVKKSLEAKGLRVTIDARDNYTPGWKFNYLELKGAPVRVEIGPRDIKLKKVVLVRRDTGEKMTVEEKKTADHITKILEGMQSGIMKKADEFFRKNIRDASHFNEMKSLLDDKGGLIRTNWCEKSGCAEEIKNKAQADIRGTLFGKQEKIFAKCVSCGKDAKSVVYVGRAY
ncbi:MAG: proline--tRNA ligase [Candidatus Aenigmarchaeota archaeon]|nr:proline--tRNA ligase [Candidatus Aenigmarchaeota archaeon]